MQPRFYGLVRDPVVCCEPQAGWGEPQTPVFQGQLAHDLIDNCIEDVFLQVDNA